MVLESDVRREILIFLAEKPRAAGDIADGLKRSRSGISQHLSQLLSANLVACERRGAQRIYSVNVAAALGAWDGWLERGP